MPGIGGGAFGSAGPALALASAVRFNAAAVIAAIKLLKFVMSRPIGAFGSASAFVGGAGP